MELESALQESAHLGFAAKTAHLEKKKLSLPHLTQLAGDKYRLQMDKSKVTWPPAMHAPDSKAVPHSYTNSSAHLTAVTSSPSTPYRRRNGNGGGSGNGGGGNGGGGGQRSNSNNNRNSNGNRNGNQSATSLKRKPPSLDEQPVKHVNGKPVFQRMVNGKKMEWCNVCKRWTTTHNTGTHRKKSEVS